jgi:hypothetical protein
MKRLIACALSLAMTGSAWAGPAGQATSSSKATTTSKRAVKKTSSGSSVTQQLQELKQALDAQQQQIQQLRQEVGSRDQKIEQLEKQVNDSQTAVTQAQSKAEAAASQNAQQDQTVSALKGDVADLKSNVTNTALTLQETQKTIAESPLAIRFKGITITPGGFLAAETVYRNRGLTSDVNTPFNTVPFPGSPNYNTGEFFGSGRQSRISVLAEGKLKSAKLSGYYEADFLSAGVTSNNNQSNSYTMRQRQIWGQASLENGFSFTAGQMWSLVTETKKGLDNRTEALPMTIDAQYHIGFSWARQYGLRVVKNFNNKVWLGASVENPQTLLTAHGNASNFFVGAPGTGGGLYNPTANYSYNEAPDVIVKAAFEPGVGHYEVFGIFSRFRDRVYPCAGASSTSPCGGSTSPNAVGAFSDSRTGGGVGANARISVYKKQIDLGAHVLAGDGVGRYGTSTLPDVTVRPDGTLALVKSLQGLATIEWHSPHWDWYLNGGGEYAGRTAYTKVSSGKTVGVGYGSPLFANTGCFTETVPAAGNGFTPGSLSNCTGDTRVIYEGTIGFWYKLYNGPKGRIQFGPQYSYVNRVSWAGKGGPTIPSEPQGNDNMVFTSFRYYLP